MRVSIALHVDDPGQDADQSLYEAKYMNYNRQHVDMAISDEGGFIKAIDLQFPATGEDQASWAPQVFTYWSAAVCTGPADQGGAIIISGPIEPVNGKPPHARKIGDAPIITIHAGVFMEKLNTMKADGRLHTFGDVWPEPSH